MRFNKSIYLIVFVLVFPFYSSATNHYVDKNVTGGNNGTSWTNAWQSFSAINWGSIQPGDIIYISGGTDSTIYFEQLTIDKSGTAGNLITLLAGKYSPSPSGHNGRVIIDGGGTRSQSIYVSNRNYVTLKGFECRYATKGIYVENSASNIVIDSMYIYNFYGQAGIMLNGASLYTIDNVTIRNCRIESYRLFAGQTDGIYIQRAQRTFIYNNYIHQRNQDPSAHTDALQAYLANGFVIYNNFFINDSVYSPEGGGTPMILGSQGTNPVIIYNNFLYMGGIWDPGGSQNSSLWLRWYNQNPMPPTWVINNTIVVNGPRCRAAIQEYNGVMINNILAMYSTSSGMANLEENLSTAIPVDSIRNNLFYRSWSNAGFSGSFTGNGNTVSGPSWTTWVNTLGGTGMNSDPYLANNIGFEPDQGALIPDLNPNSPAIGMGENIEPYLDYFQNEYNIVLPESDIYGAPRNINNPSIGAYEYSGSDTTFPLIVSLSDGWNLVSVPGINPNGMEINTWWEFRDLSTNVFRFSNGYETVASTEPGVGYIMKQILSRTYNTGDEWPATGILNVPHDPLNGVPGWNLIGGYELSINVANITTIPPGLISGPVYKFSGGYYATSVMKPGFGYWIKLNGAGQIILPEIASKEPDSKEWFPENWGKIILTDATGTKYTLYAVQGEVDLSQYELPPLPRNGMFDVRFSSGRIAEQLDNSEKTIEMSGINYPLKVKVENLNLTLTDEYRKKVSADLINGEEIFISDNTINKLKIVSGQILNPVLYSLEQNYPNPFNPTTNIKFSIPDESDVNLSVYNILGELISTLVNEKLKAGYYDFNFDGTKCSSGIYFYRIKTGSFIETKKMILLR
jgi:hypothetical protein